MATADIEELRQSTISAYQLGGERGPEFDAVTALAADLFDVPIALVTVLSADRQMFQGACGIDIDGTAREDAFCNRTVEQDGVYVVEDASIDPGYASNPLVIQEPFIRFYAGAPIRIGDGVAIGSMCLIDRKPRTFSAREAERLKMLAGTVADMIELRIGSRVAEQRKESLQRQSELLRATIDHVQQGIGLFGRDLGLMLWNERLTDLLGLPPATVHEGARADQLLLAVAERGVFGQGEASAVVAELLHSIQSTPSRRLDLNMPDGRIVDVWRAAISDGRSIITVQDVTEQRRMARIKDEFVSTVSHELRTPLTAIRGALAILDRNAAEQSDPRAQQMLSMAGRNAERLTNLINEILDIEKLDSGTLAMNEEPLDLRDVLHAVTEQNRTFAAAHAVELALEVGQVALHVTGDARRLQQAVANLISNACKYSPAGKIVRVRGERSGDHALISVEDEGPGIPVDFRPHIFGRFSQASPEHQGAREGTGLGLAITRAIIDRHHGQIGFDPNRTIGSEFWIRLPLRSGSE